MGTGDIGQEIAKVGKVFGMRVLALVRNKQHRGGRDAALQFVDQCFDSCEETAQFLSKCDYFVNCLPSTPHTRKMLGLKELAHCKKGSVFINVGRGDVVDDGCNQEEEGTTLLKALEEGYLEEVILDVFRGEPLHQDNKLWDHNRKSVVTPHVAAISLADDVSELFCENLKLYLEDKPLRFGIDWTKGY